jgi:hypothetical protein
MFKLSAGAHLQSASELSTSCTVISVDFIEIRQVAVSITFNGRSSQRFFMDDTDNDYLGQHRHQDSLPAGPDQGCDGKEAKDADTDNDYTTDTIDTDNDYTIDDTTTAHFLFLIPPHKPSAPTQAGAHVENAENA